MLFAKIKQHYEAVVAVCCFLILFTNVGLPSTSFSVYQPYLVDLPGVGHSGGSIIVSVRFWPCWWSDATTTWSIAASARFWQR